jgi:hypothetical protein
MTPPAGSAKKQPRLSRFFTYRIEVIDIIDSNSGSLLPS